MKQEDKPGWGGITLMGVLHFLCCGIPLLLLSSVSLTFVFPQWPVVAVVLAVVGVVLVSRPRDYAAARG